MLRNIIRRLRRGKSVVNVRLDWDEEGFARAMVTAHQHLNRVHAPVHIHTGDNPRAIVEALRRAEGDGPAITGTW